MCQTTLSGDLSSSAFDDPLPEASSLDIIFNLAIMYFRENRFIVGTKLLGNISLVRRISSVMPD